MTILLATSELEDFVSDQPDRFTTTTTFFDANFARAAIVTGVCSHVLSSNVTDFWLGYTMYPNNSGTAVFTTLKHAGTGFLRLLRDSGNGPIRVEVFDGTWMTLMTSNVSLVEDAVRRVALHVIVDAEEGAIEVFQEGHSTGKLVGANTIGSVLAAGVDEISLTPAGGTTYYSEIIFADEDVTQMRVSSMSPIDNSAATDIEWRGNVNNIKEVNPNKKKKFASTGKKGKKFLVETDNVTATPLAVRAVRVSAYSNSDDIGITDLEMTLRVNGTNYSDGGSTLGNTVTAVDFIWDLNPDTDQLFTVAEVDNIEIGVNTVGVEDPPAANLSPNVLTFTDTFVTSSSTVDAGKPAGTGENDVLVAYMAADWEAGMTVTLVPAGWIEVANNDITDEHHIGVWYKVAGVSEPATWTWGVSETTKTWGMIVARIENANVASPVGNSVLAFGLGSQFVSMTTGFEDSLIVHFGSSDRDLATSLDSPIQTNERIVEGHDGVTGFFHGLSDEPFTNIGLIGNRVWVTDSAEEEVSAFSIEIKKT